MARIVANVALAALAAAVPAPGTAQVAIGLGVGVAYGPVLAPVPVYGPYAPVVVAPYPLYGPYAPVIVAPYPLFGYSYGYGGYGYGGAGFVYPPPRSDGLPSCYRVGRCTLADLFALGGRPDRLDRLAPTAPDPPYAGRAFELRANVPPTPVDEIQPEYRGASLPRDEFKESGMPR